MKLAIVSCFSVLVGCSYQIEKKSQPGGDYTKLGATIGFQEILTQVFVPKCISCHSSFNNYASVAILKDLIRVKVSSGDMPRPSEAGPLTDIQKNLLMTWLNQGAPEVSSAPSTPAQPNTPSTQPPNDNNDDSRHHSNKNPQDSIIVDYQTVLSRVFSPSCIECHNSFANYKVVFELKDRMKFKIRSGLMPPINEAAPLTEEQSDLLLNWLDQGAPATQIPNNF